MKNKVEMKIEFGKPMYVGGNSYIGHLLSDGEFELMVDMQSQEPIKMYLLKGIIDNKRKCIYSSNGVIGFVHAYVSAIVTVDGDQLSYEIEEIPEYPHPIKPVK